MHRRKLILRSVLALLSLLLILNVPSVSGHRSGGYSHDSSIGYSNPDWMGTLPDALRISELSIPGTHDTMTFPGWGGDAVQCQNMSLSQQLLSGIRVLDIRCRHIEDVFAIHHGEVYQHREFGKHVLQPVNDFLSQHPTETVLMRVKEEYEPENNTRSFAETFEWYMSIYGQRVWQPTSDNPTLGEVRGKIVILDNFASGQYGLNWTDAEIQDWYHFTTNWDLDDKWYKIQDHLIAADTGSMDDIYINFLSGSGGSFPYFVASGHSSPGTGAPRLWTGMLWDNVTGSTCGSTNCYPFFPRLSCCCWPWWIKTCSVFFEGTNEITYNYLRANSDTEQGNRWGIIMADFPGAGLIDAIISSNFPSGGWAALVSANGPYEGDEGSEIIFEASPSGAGYQYQWHWNRCDVDDQGVCIPGTEWSYTTDWSNDPTTSYTWYDDWNGTATVWVTDGNVTHNAETEVTVNNVAPVVSLDRIQDEMGAEIPGDVPVALVHLEIEVAGSFTDVGTQDTHTAIMDWGDGTTHDLGPVSGPTSDSYAYPSPGNYEIKLIVTDDDTGVSLASQTITVVDAARAIEVVVDLLLPHDGDPNVTDAIDKLRGEDGGEADNGALDMMAKGNLNAAMEKILQAEQALEPVDLPHIKSLLALAAKSGALQLIGQAEAAASKKNELRKIEEAKALMEQADACLADHDFVGAVGKCQAACRELAGIQ